MKETVNSDRLHRATELDIIIGQGLKKTIQSILEIGSALKVIRDDKYYKELGYTDFESYTTEKWELPRSTAYSYIAIIEKMPPEFVQRVGQMDKPLSFRRLTQISVSFGPDTEHLHGLSSQDIEKLRDMSDSDFQKVLSDMNGYDRSKMGGRGPKDLNRPEISRDRYRDQHKKIIHLEEQIKTFKSEKTELLSALEKAQSENADLNRILASDDKTKELTFKINAITKRLGELESEKARTEAQKADADHAIQLITEFRINFLLAIKRFREQISLPDIEVAAWFDMTFDDILVDVERNRNFIAEDFLNSIKEPYPEGASSALAVLTKQDGTIRANIEKALTDLGYREVIDKTK